MVAFGISLIIGPHKVFITILVPCNLNAASCATGLFVIDLHLRECLLNRLSQFVGWTTQSSVRAVFDFNLPRHHKILYLKIQLKP
jgi:hypothetical protein